MPQTPNTREKGNSAEDKACEFLEGLGYRIIKRNFHFGRYGELDIIAEDKDALVFIEVKSRYSDKFGDPLLSVTPRKQKNMRKAAEGYLYVNKIQDKECRFDIITVDYRRDKENPEILHYVNAM